MIVRSAICRVAEHEHRSVFFPWGGFFTLGSIWGYEVSINDSLDELLRQYRRYQSVTVFFVVIAIPLGAWLDLVWPCLATGILVPMFLYTLFIHRRMKSSVRIPVDCSLAIFSAKVGAEFLWRNVFLGAFCVVCSVWLPAADAGLTTFTVASVINSFISLYVLRTVPN